MKATEILYEEHRIIMTVLNCLEKMAAEAERNGKLNAPAANSAITFFRNFADGCHHSKEEDRLFVVMQEHGIPREGGPIGVMLTEHDHGRHLVGGMARSVDAASQGDSTAIQTFAQNVRDFLALLSTHINKEDHVLFPMANQVLDGAAADNMLADFRQIESLAGGKRHKESIELAKQLCEQYGVDFVTEAQIPTITTEFCVE